ncbi:arylsulfatase [Planctomycetales bacterium ZRK34]|nr:arylsulfatase [Planctomycetales bacterium ZRK34]
MMTNVSIRYCAAIGMAVLCGLAMTPVLRGQEAARPNVLLILADDMCLGDLARNNGGLNRTPRLDQLAQQSVYLTHGYSGSAVCAPARAALLTGRYPHRTGVTSLSAKSGLTRLRLDETTIADLFAAQGYATGLVGKWHTGDGPEFHPLKRGFQEFAGFVAGDGAIKSYFKYPLDIQGQQVHFEDRYLTDHFTELSIDFIRRHRDKSFFLHLAHYAPHRPLNAPQKIVDRYKKQGFSENTAIIYAMIEVLDRGVGQVLDELDKLGLSDNTIVIFSSDNGLDPLPGERGGGHRFNCNLRGTKYTVHEGGIHVPFMIRWPGQLKPGVNDTLVQFQDVLPTLAAACGIDLPDTLQLDGRNVLEALRRGQTASAPVRYWQWNRGLPLYSHNAAMRDGQWKLVRPYVSGNNIHQESKKPPMLFDLSNDPAEQHNLADKYPQRTAEMNQSLAAWADSVERDRTRPLAGQSVK